MRQSKQHNESKCIGSWGDQGDGTYRNPILNADYPDVDLEQVGDTYYMISSKQHMAPGMVILESKDMVNWITIGHVWPKLSWGSEYGWDRIDGYACGVAAGDLAYHDGSWYCYQIDFNHGLFMSKARDIRGPWSEPHKMLENTDVKSDPGVYWDEGENQAYLICNTGKKQMAKGDAPGNQNRIYKMSWDGREILDRGTLVYTGPGTEAAKIYKINGIWYLFFAEWHAPGPPRPYGRPLTPESDRRQIVLRSTTDSIYGPYEKRIVLKRGNGIERSCSQGALMKAPNGSWWYTHQLIQNTDSPIQGRPQCIEPVQWIDGWPIIGKDVDGDGIGEPVLSHQKPINGHPITAPPSDDDFDSKTLGLQWEWNHNPRDTHWSLSERPGWLRLKASVPVSGGGFWKSCNTISQRLMGTGKGRACAKFDISSMRPGQRAGFVRFGGVFHLLGVHVQEDGVRSLFFDAKGDIVEGPPVKGGNLWIQTTNDGNQASFRHSVDGETYLDFGPTFTLEFGKWTGDRLGFFCWNDREEAGHIDIDWFHYNYDGPKS